ncbi:MAG TPA: BMC domain-containing protein [Anaerolineae bacterium]|jgi:microcompartment protein CcmL/EutN|nr:BMC domain-containing protein [Anaerolineae bacterium]
MYEPALALLEFTSIAAGIEAADAMVKRAPIEVIVAGTVQPGKYLVMIGGEVAAVEESLAAGRHVGGEAAVDFVYLPHVHPQVVEAVCGGRQPEATDALGIVETSTVAAAIHAADAGIKGAEVSILEVRLADGLGGKGIVLFSGVVANVEAAVEIGVGALERPELLVRQVVIPQLHREMWDNVSSATRFRDRVSSQP